MTTQAAANIYEAQHVYTYAGRKVAVFNPHEKNIGELPVIYGFNNGGSAGWLSAVLLAADGECLGSHCCSSEAYMPHDLGIIEGTREDRHETFREHYPDGYRMEFVSSDELEGHKEFNAAIAMANAKAQEKAA